MFGLFESKETKRSKYILQSLKKIEEAGGALAVCEKFGDWFVSDELVKTLGIASESQAPFQKAVLMLAAVNLLGTVKNAGDSQGLESPLSYAKSTYIASALLVEDKKVIEIINACKAGEVHPAELLKPYFDLKEKHEEAWEKYLISDYDFSSAHINQA